jgi:hypothetical protein
MSTRAWWINLASPSLKTCTTFIVKTVDLHELAPHLGLQPALQEVLDLEAEHVV